MRAASVGTSASMPQADPEHRCYLDAERPLPSPEAIQHARHSGMRSVFDLDPFASAGAVAPRLMLGENPLEPHTAGRCEEFGPDLAPLERRNENTLSATSQELVELTLAVEERQIAQMLAADEDQVEGVKLGFLVVLVGMQGIEVGDALHIENADLASMTNCCCRIFRAVSTIQGNRQAQSSPLLDKTFTFLPSRTIRPR